MMWASRSARAGTNSDSGEFAQLRILQGIGCSAMQHIETECNTAPGQAAIPAVARPGGALPSASDRLATQNVADFLAACWRFGMIVAADSTTRACNADVRKESRVFGVFWPNTPTDFSVIGGISPRNSDTHRTEGARCWWGHRLRAANIALRRSSTSCGGKSRPCENSEK